MPHAETTRPATGSPTGPVNPMHLSPEDLLPFDDLVDRATGCTRCGLSENRTKVVFGEGDPGADLMIVGEWPGRHEDLQARPFAGALGNLLGKTLSMAGLRREDCYLTHVVKCRPPTERGPRPDEVSTCLPYLVQQIGHVRPRVILTMGPFATQVVLRRQVPIAKVAGFRLDVFDGVTLIPTHHPASALRGNPTALTALKRDVRTAKAVLDGELPTGAETVEMAQRQTAGT